MENILVCTGHELRFKNVIRAENCSLYDSSGRKYLDLESGVWCTSVGHCNPRITKVINEQAAKIIHTGYSYLDPIMEITAEKLLRITGIHRGKCLFLCSGSEAVEFCVKTVQFVSDKPCILTLKDS